MKTEAPSPNSMPLASAGLIAAAWAGRLLIAAQLALCFGLGIADRGRLIASLTLAFSLFSPLGFRLAPAVHALLLVGIGLLFAILAMVRFLGDNSTGLLELFELLAEYLLMVQAFELLRNRASELGAYREVNYLPGLSAITITMLMVTREVPISLAMASYSSIGLVFLLAFVLRPDIARLMVGDPAARLKALTLGALILISITVGTLFSGEIARQLPQLQAMLRALQPPSDEFERVIVNSQANFVEHVDLSSIANAQRSNPEELVYRIESGSPPGYMRTMSFETFDGNGWQNTWNKERGSRSGSARSLPPLAEIPAELASLDKPPNYNLFAIPDRQRGSYIEMTVTVPAQHGRLVPLPLTAAYLIATSAARTRQLVVDVHGNVWPNAINNDRYRVLASTSMQWPVEANYAKRLKQLPADEAQFLRDYSTRVCGAATTTREKIRATTSYFTESFSYSLEPNAIGELRGRPALRAFLENRQSGHCEFFATASTLLLRAQNIPCRLSTGYLVYQMNDGHDYYFARNRDAHAWAEAYDEKSNEWIVVEATPGVREYTQRFMTSADDLARDTARPAGDQNRLMSSLGELFAFFQATLQRLMAWRFAWSIPIAIGGFLVIVQIRRNLRPPVASPDLVSHSVRKADKVAAKLGFRREQSETCLQFSARLSAEEIQETLELAEWYRLHSQSRYVSLSKTELYRTP